MAQDSLVQSQAVLREPVGRLQEAPDLVEVEGPTPEGLWS
ncbi:hypothetical protein AK812_SmicGene47793, partial [Symbiodinium microadriaticum]